MVKSSNIEISVIIPTYNRYQSLKRALESVLELDFPKDKYEVVIVDNNSTDDTWLVENQFQDCTINIKYVKETRLSFTLARHVGAEAASGKIISYIDDDVVVDNKWLVAVIEAFDNNPNAGIVGGPIHPIFEHEPPDWITRYYPMSGWLSLMDLGPNTHETQYAYGPNISIRRDVFELVDGFPPDTIGVESGGKSGVVEKIYVGGGDVGLCDKVQKAGYKVIYSPGALVHHVIPPVRITKKWWHSRFGGEGYYHAITNQYENQYGRTRLLMQSLSSTWSMIIKAGYFLGSGVLKKGKERHEFMISYYMTRARVELALARNPGLAQQLWDFALSGVPPENIHEMIHSLP